MALALPLAAQPFQPLPASGLSMPGSKQGLDSIITEHYIPSSSTWIYGEKRIFTYNGCGKTMLCSEYAYDPYTLAWLPSFRDEYYYDPMGQLAMMIHYGWDEVNARWDRISKMEMLYDAGGRLWSRSYLDWSVSASMWKLKGTETYSYGPGGELTTITTHNWNASTGQNEPASQDVYAWHTSGLVSTITHHLWNEGSSLFEPALKKEFQWTNSGHPETVTDLVFDPVLCAFINTLKVEYLYDLWYNVGIVIRYNWDPAICHWAWYQKEELQYNNNIELKNLLLPQCTEGEEYLFLHMLTQRNVYQFTGGIWCDAMRNTYHYSYKTVASVGEVSETQFKLWPNPVSEFLCVNIPENKGVCTIALFDHRGSLVLECKAGNQLPLNVSHLPSGIYLCKIIGEDGNIHGLRVVKQ